MDKSMEKRVKEWMGHQLFANTYDYFDGIDVDLTKLGEDAAETFDIYENVADIPEWVWEVAFEVSEEFDEHRNREEEDAS